MTEAKGGIDGVDEGGNDIHGSISLVWRRGRWIPAFAFAGMTETGAGMT